jgi:hypothetical protein
VTSGDMTSARGTVATDLDTFRGGFFPSDRMFYTPIGMSVGVAKSEDVI